ncbi:hypothetical protein [Reyranella sp.]|uniref:hypothetical protein n=1 Tax=Reyranella sp. TaxID=1929291 RepID=UPI0025F89DE5|nr:hypothetical protein [Reyranella sp.]
MPPIKLELPPHLRRRNWPFVEPRKSWGLIPMVSNDDYKRERYEEGSLATSSRPPARN